MSQTLRETESNMLPKIPEGTPVIKASEAPPKAKMGEPEFENLTSAEKLNDSRYRSSIYRTYPNEPTCVCANELKKSYIVSNCPGGCTSRCCSTSRGKSRKKRNPTNLVRSKRLRGGGEGIGNLDFSDMYNNGYRRGYNSRTNDRCKSNFKFRLGGGGGGLEEQSNINKNMRYSCPHKEGRMQRENNQEAIKKPCLEIDCLLKKYEDAQEFVDSLGKVPGLAGLGLADPSESPYFGRSKEDDDDELTIDNFINCQPLPNHKTNRNCPDVCNPKFSNNKSMDPGRLGVIRELVPVSPVFSSSVVPGTKIKKKDEKNEKQKEGEPSLVTLEESGPCGDPKCRSKRKKINVEGEGNSILKGSSKLKVQEKYSKSDNKDKGRNKYVAGASEDQSGSKSSMKMVRKIGKFVYSAGDTYPGLNCGHKTCVGGVARVPPNMGWMWRPEIPVGRLKPRVGWKPGAINAGLRRVLREVKANFWQAGRPKSAPSRSRGKGSVTRRKRSVSLVRKMAAQKPEIAEEEWKEPPPTLHIHRKDGVYYVTMYPIKQDTMDIPKLEEPTKPLQFKIMKNRDDASDVSSSTASDMEIEFSPPAAVNRYRKKPDVIHVEIQVRQQEILDAYKPPGPKKTEKKAGKEKKAKK